MILLSFTLIVTNACQLGLIHQYATNFNPKVMMSMMGVFRISNESVRGEGQKVFSPRNSRQNKE